MTSQDNRDILGQFENVPMRTRRDTTGHPPLGGVPVSRPVPLASPAERSGEVEADLRRLARALEK